MTLQFSDAPRPKPQDWQLDDAPSDPLAASLAAVMLHTGVDIDHETMRAGLPLPNDGRLTPGLAVRAASNSGFRATLSRLNLKDIPDSVLPVVLFLKGRDACVLLERSTHGEARVIWPKRSGDPERVPLASLNEEYAGHALLLRRENEMQSTEAGSSTNQQWSHWLWGTVRGYWPAYVQVAIASALVNILALATPLFTMNVYDRVFPNAALVTLWSLVAGVALALTFDAALKWVRAKIVDNTGRRIDLAVSSAIFAHLTNLSLNGTRERSGRLANTLKDYEQVVEFFSSQTLATIMDLMFAILFIAVIAYIGGPLAWPPALALAGVTVVGVLSLWPLRRAAVENRATGGAKTAIAVESLAEPETLKAISGHGRMQGRWERHVSDAARVQSKSRGIATFATTVTGLAQQGASVGIVIIGVYLALEGQITMGAVIAAMILSSRALAPSAALSALFVRGSFALSTLKSLNALMKRPSDVSSGDSLNSKGEAEGLALDNVSLTYPNAPLPALSGIATQVAPGERVAVIGPVGSGKTSFVRVLSGLWPPTEGLVLIDGLNMAQVATPALRQRIQVVQQEAVLFSGTLAENIAFGRPGARDTEIVGAAQAAGVDRFAAEHPDGFGMMIEERGRNLSGGQRQLVALARALIQAPDVLVLDEPTSAMDMQTERILVESLAALLERRQMTLILATHRMGLLELADRTILMSRGKILMDGPTKGVLARLESNSGASE